MPLKSLQNLMKLPQKWAISLLCFGISLSQSHAQLGPPPIIGVQPLGLSVSYGDTAIFLVGAVSVTHMSYQWYHDDKKIGGADQAICTIDHIKPKDAGKYWVQIKNASGTTVSSNATLIVLSRTVTITMNVLPPVLTTNGVGIHLSVPPGSDFVVYGSSDLRNWIPLSTNPAPTGDVNFTDTAATNLNSRYYKALLQ